ncbi:MAG: hypothetical protein FJ255_09770 [Phycisphaerae bacterium]|nr:hypothetical protein [Phycisphaerae bacterium]
MVPTTRSSASASCPRPTRRSRRINSTWWLDAEYEYRIEPVWAYLRSTVVNPYASPPTLLRVAPVRDDEYRFTVLSAANQGGG